MANLAEIFGNEGFDAQAMQIHYVDPVAEFRAAISTAGLIPPDDIEPGRYYRFAGKDKPQRNRDAALFLFDDLKGGWWIDYSSGYGIQYVNLRNEVLSDSDYASFRKRCDAERKKREKETQDRYIQKQSEVTSLLQATDRTESAVINHPYYLRKSVDMGFIGRGAFPQAGWDDALLIPLVDVNGELWSIQAVSPEGEKRYLKGARRQETFHHIGPKITSIVMIGEGVATVAAVVDATGYPAVAAMDTSQLLPVAKAIKKKHPQARIVILADNDVRQDGTNPGLKYATEAANELNASLAVPELSSGGKCDWWDVWSLEGREYVSQQINSFISNLIVPIEYSLSLLKPTEFVIDGFLSTGITLMAGAPGVGKTSALLPLAAMAAHLCAQDDPMKPIIRRKVIYITEDIAQAERSLYGLYRYHSMTIKHDEFREWFNLIPAKRSSPDDVAQLIREAGARFAVMHRHRKIDYKAYPLVVLDTASACIDMENENDNAEAGRAIAAIKEALGSMPAWIIGHTPKALKRGDVRDLSMRGASSFEGDVHATSYIFYDEALDKRVLSLGKRRFEAEFDEIHFDSAVIEEEVQTPWGEPQQVMCRVGIPVKASSTERSKAHAVQKQDMRAHKEQMRRMELLDNLKKMEVTGDPILASRLALSASCRKQTAYDDITFLVRNGYILRYKIDPETGVESVCETLFDPQKNERTYVRSQVPV